MEEFINDVNFPVYKDVDSLRKIIKENKINIVVITEPTELILTIPHGVKIYKMPDFYELITGRYYVDEKTITELFISTLLIVQLFMIFVNELMI